MNLENLEAHGSWWHSYIPKGLVGVRTQAPVVRGQTKHDIHVCTSKELVRLSIIGKELVRLSIGIRAPNRTSNCLAESRGCPKCPASLWTLGNNLRHGILFSGHFDSLSL